MKPKNSLRWDAVIMDKKQRIILTMLELVVEQGVNATPMSQVAKEANVAVGTIYHYFENKNQIIEEIYTMIIKDFGVILMANLPDGPFKNKYQAMWLNLYNYFIGNPLAFKFMEYVGIPPIINQEIRQNSVKHFTNVRDFMLAGILNKDLKDVNLRLIMQISFGTAVSAVRLKSKNELPMTEKQIQDAVEIAWDSVKYKSD